MKILLLHSDAFEFEATKKAIKAAEELEKKSGQVKDALVVFISVEKQDEKHTQLVAEKGSEEIEKVFNTVKALNIVLYPYVHLSSRPSSPSAGLDVIKSMEAIVSKKGIHVVRAPFGWYKKFSIKVKGHPLAELSREITPEISEKVTKIPKIILDRKDLPSWDHRILGQELGIFTFSEEVGPSLPLWLPNGETLRNELIKYMREVEEMEGYRYVHTPDIILGKMYEQTGHLPYFRESMYSPIEIEGQDYYLRPMNCPHHHMVYRKLVKSYRDLPLRLAEPGTTYRNELSGVTYGLMRVKCFTQNDSHIYVTPGQLGEEFLNVLRLIKKVYKVMGIKDYWFRLSLPDFKRKPDKFTGNPKEWEKVTKDIRNVFKEFGEKLAEEEGEAAFYGPKIDIQIKNAQGKEETIATSQVDIVVPKRLGLFYTDKDDMKKTPIVIHRAILGSYERFIAYLLEQTRGFLPVWLSPVQVRVLSFTERNTRAVDSLVREFREKGIRSEADTRNNTVEYKVRDAELLRIPYILVIGDKEEKARTVAVRSRGAKKVEFGVKKDTFLRRILEAIRQKA